MHTDTHMRVLQIYKCLCIHTYTHITHACIQARTYIYTCGHMWIYTRSKINKVLYYYFFWQCAIKSKHFHPKFEKFAGLRS